MKQPDLSAIAISGATLDVRVTTNAGRNAVQQEDGRLRVMVTTVPEDGKANAAVIKLLSKALGVPKSRIELMRGAKSRDKTFRILD